jgi:hypothetical protein
MKHLRLSLAVITLMLALSLSAFAGDIQCGVTSTQPPNQASTTSNRENFASSGTVSENTAIDPVTEIALSLMQSMLSLF